MSELVDPADHQDAHHIAPNHIEAETGRLLPYSTVRQDGVTSPKHRFRSGQILYSKIRPYLAKVVLADFDGLCSADMYPIETDLDAVYLKWWMLTREFTRRAAGEQARTVLPKINRNGLSQLPVPVPPRDEQRRIVDILEDHLSRLDTAMDGMSTVERRACAMVTASAAHQVSAASLNSPVATVGQLARLVEYGSGAKTEVRDGSGFVPVLRMGNIKEGSIDWSTLKFLPTDHPDFPRLLLKSGDLLFNRTNSAEHVGKSAVFDAAFDASFASYLIRVRFDEKVVPQWANIVINSPQGRNYVSTVVSQQVGQANVNGTKLKAFPIVVPLVEEQLRRVTEHQRVVEAGRTLRVEITGAQGRAAALRRALLAAAFSGRLTGRHTDQEVIEGLAQ